MKHMFGKPEREAVVTMTDANQDAHPARNVRLAAALAYARRGWAIHPLRPGDKLPLLKDWPHNATTNEQTIAAWWRQWPDANIGLACGPSRLLVVDLDVKGRVDGRATWDALAARLGRAERYFVPVPDGPTAQTAKE